MNVSFRQLRLFLALAETSSVSAAARAMHVTQPTASMQLKEMAQAIGLPLLHQAKYGSPAPGRGHAGTTELQDDPGRV